VDRAALDFALSNGLICRGWCPLNREAEDGRINDRYTLSETFSPDPLARTELNVADSDATLIIYSEHMDAGTLATRDFAYEYHKPFFIWRVGVNNNALTFKRWLHTHKVQVLNIAGPRASSAADIYVETLQVLDELLEDYVKMADRRMF